jgi:hypothetical protein
MKTMIRQFLARLNLLAPAERLYNFLWRMLDLLAEYCLTILSHVMTPYRLLRNARKPTRYLEIGPGQIRLPDFETLNIVGGRQVDYVADAMKRLPFKDHTFDIVYASHVLEHIPWYMVEEVLKEWIRIIKINGRLEIWVPDGLKIASALVDFEKNGADHTALDGWYRFNQRKDPCIWASGRIFTYGDGKGNTYHWNWHRALFTPRYLKEIMTRAGLSDVMEMDQAQVRGNDHGWINLGMMGIKR